MSPLWRKEALVDPAREAALPCLSLRVDSRKTSPPFGIPRVAETAALVHARLASRPTLDRFYRCCRVVMALNQECTEPFDGDLELDETMFGGRRKGKRGWGASGKVIVFGILQRNGQVRVAPIPRRNREEVMYLVRTHTEPGSLYFTDDWQAYASLALRGNHVVVRKSGGVPMGRDHINGIEGFWSYAKHWLYPLRGVPKKFLHIFLGEISYRFNHRKENLYPLILNMLRNTEINAIKHYLVRNT